MDAAQAARDRYDSQVKALYAEVDALMPPNLSSEGKNTIQFVEKYIADSQTATGKDDLDAALRLAEKLLQDADNGALQEIVLFYSQMNRPETLTLQVGKR